MKLLHAEVRLNLRSIRSGQLRWGLHRRPVGAQQLAHQVCHLHGHALLRKSSGRDGKIGREMTREGEGKRQGSGVFQGEREMQELNLSVN